MSFPVSFEQAAAGAAAPVTPSTLRKSRRLKALLLLPSALRTSGRSSAVEGAWLSELILVVAVRAVVARLLALTRRGGGGGQRDALAGCGLLRRIARGFLAFFGAVAVDVTT